MNLIITHCKDAAWLKLVFAVPDKLK